jgi:alpha-tubulin suppressor-like RCC1 family protein
MMKVGRTIALALCVVHAARASAVQDEPALATRVAAGAFHTCAIALDGETICWGDNREGQSGGQPGGAVAVHALPGPRLIEIAAGGQHTCGLDGQGRAWCWGDNRFGQLGEGTTESRSTEPPSDVLTGVRAIAAGSGSTCALMTSGGVRCWGANFEPQSSSGGEPAYETTPPISDGLSGVEAIFGGESHVCALMTGGGVRCWGDNRYGQLGEGAETGPHPEPPPSDLITGVLALALGSRHSCA